MSLCAQCGTSLIDGVELCPYHVTGSSSDDAESSRVIADLLHRGKEPERLSAAQREVGTDAADA